MMSGYRVTHSSAAGRFADGQPGPEGIHQANEDSAEFTNPNLKIQPQPQPQPCPSSNPKPKPKPKLQT